MQGGDIFDAADMIAFDYKQMQKLAPPNTLFSIQTSKTGGMTTTKVNLSKDKKPLYEAYVSPQTSKGLEFKNLLTPVFRNGDYYVFTPLFSGCSWIAAFTPDRIYFLHDRHPKELFSEKQAFFQQMHPQKIVRIHHVSDLQKLNPNQISYTYGRSTATDEKQGRVLGSIMLFSRQNGVQKFHIQETLIQFWAEAKSMKLIPACQQKIVS